MLSATGADGQQGDLPAFNILPVSVIKAKQRIKNKIGLSSTDSLDKYIQQH